MKVTFIGHASLLIEANGVKVLSDPWWDGPCFGAQWWPYPLPYVQALEGQHVDYIYISHGHHDHFHPPTLKRFSGAKVLVGAGSELSGSIRDLGFEVIEAEGSAEIDLRNGVYGRIVATYADDTFLAISDGRESCINLNDAIHAAPETVQKRFCQLIRHLYGRPSYVFCGYGTASHFPNSYVIPGKNQRRTAAMRQAHFNRAWARVIHELQPRFGFPFAADVAFLESSLSWCNEPVHNAERPTEVFTKQFGRATGIRVIDIAPGFIIDGGEIVQGHTRERISSEEIQRVYRDAIVRVNRVAPVDSRTVCELRDLLERNIAKGAAYFAGYDGEYRCLLLINGAEAGIRVTKSGRNVVAELTDNATGTGNGYDVVYRTRASYLRQSLSTKYGHETLFVGSGGIFEISSRSKVRAGIHRELMAMLKPIEGDGPRRTKGRVGVIGAAKRALRRLLGISRDDLYDLEKWTVFDGSVER